MVENQEPVQTEAEAQAGAEVKPAQPLLWPSNIQTYSLEATFLNTWKTKASTALGGKNRLSKAKSVLDLRAKPRKLSQLDIALYEQDGWLVIYDVLTKRQLDKLVEEANAVLDRLTAGGDGVIKHVFAGELSRPSPCGRVLATPELGENGQVSEQGERPIVRLGAGIHQMMPGFKELTHSTFHRDLAKSLGYKNPRVTSSHIVTKSTSKGTVADVHQDSVVSFTEPLSAMTLWYALDDCLVDNGCLHVAESSQIYAPIKHRLVKDSHGNPRSETLMEPLWYGHVDVPRNERKERTASGCYYEPLEVSRGSLILVNGSLLYRSGLNESGRGRLTYLFTIVEGDSKCPEDSYMMPKGGRYVPL